MHSPRHLTSRRVVRASLLSIIVLSVACRDKQPAARSDSDLSRDLALAGAPSVQQPTTFQDTAIAPNPTRASSAKSEQPAPKRSTASERPQPHVERPRPTTPAPAPQPVQAPAPAPIPAPAPQQQAAPAQGQIGAGTSMALTTSNKVCTDTNLPGDKIVATVNSDVTGSNGAVIPAGSSVVLEVAAVNSGNSGENAQITFRVRSILVKDKTFTPPGDVTVNTPLERTKEAGDPNGDKKKVIGGAIAGAILGQILGHNTKGTVIGAATGAAAGAAAAHMSQKWEGCLPAGASLKLTLNGPVVM